MIQSLKKGLAVSIANISYLILNKKCYFLCLEPSKYDNLSSEILKGIFERMTEDEKNLAYFYYWELSKKDIDTRITGENYGRDQFWENLKITSRSLHRSGLLLKYYDPNDTSLILVEYHSRFTTIESQYYSLGERKGHDYPIGNIGFINGMGNTLGWAGTDASRISNSILDSVDLHCVYLPSLSFSADNYSPNNGVGAFIKEATRHLSVTGGLVDRCSCILAQLWIDYLIENPNKYFLQIAASDGATFTKTALYLVNQYCPEILSRLNLLLLAPGTVIVEGIHSNQIINLIKLEDHLITKLGNGASKHTNGKHQNVFIVPHEHKDYHPHDFTNPDYMYSAKQFIENFKCHGKLII